MTTEQRPENLEKEPARPKRRSLWLILVGIVLLGVAATCAALFKSGYRWEAGGIEFLTTVAGLTFYEAGALLKGGLAFLMTVAGLGGLICMVLGLVRLVSNERNLR